MRLFLDLNGKIESTIFLAGVGRSGTTWVADVINARNSFRVMFEPFFPQKVALCRQFRYRQYLRPDDSNPAYLGVARTILSGKIRNPWIDRYNKRLIVTKRLIKDIRANLMLKWLKVNFPQLRVVVLMRHPCAVATSKLKSGWGTHLQEFIDQADLMADHLNPFRRLMTSVQSDFERHILLWCVENYVPLRQFTPGEAFFALYERLCTQPALEYERLFDFLGLDFSQKYFAAFGRPSVMSRSGSAVVQGANLIDAWRKDISEEQIKKAKEILSIFGLAGIYGDDPMPLADPNQVGLG